MRTDNRKERIEKNLRGFVNKMERVLKKHHPPIKGLPDLKKTLIRKNFNPDDELYNRSKNLKDFVNHRQGLNQFNRNRWMKSVYLPYVMRFHNTQITKEFSDRLDEFISTYPILSMGCHNLADRISVKFPDKISSVRTRISFNHMGYDKILRNSIGSKVHKFKEKNGMVKRILDDGKMWLNHSINLVKDENVYSQFFNQTGTNPPNETNPLKDKNPSLYEFIGNGVLVDYDVMHFPNVGVYNSFEYKGLGVYSFENFTREELDWVEDWLDWEFFQLYFFNKSIPFHFLTNLNDNYFVDFKDVVLELGDEIGNKYLKYLVIPEVIDFINFGAKTKMEQHGVSGVQKFVDDFQSEIPKEEWEGIVIKSLIEPLEKYKKDITEKVEYFKDKFDMYDDNSPTNDLEGDEMKDERLEIATSFLSDFIDLETLKPKF